MVAVYSAPVTQRSASTSLSYCRASSHASPSSRSDSTRRMPMLEPSCVGLTISGKPSSDAVARSSSSRRTAKPGVGSRMPCHTSLVRYLSMQMADPVTSLPVAGMPSIASAPWITPSSPPRPCKTMNARSNPPAAISWREPGPVTSTAWASMPRRCRPASTALPLFRDTSRSAAVPPMSTATFPKSAAVSVMPRLPRCAPPFAGVSRCPAPRAPGPCR